MKKLISAAWTGCSVNWDQLSRALLQYRNTPCRKDGLSPAQKLFGHPVQNTLPAHCGSFAPEWQRSSQEADVATIYRSETSLATYDQHAHPLSDLQVGNHVAVQNPTSKMWDIGMEQSQQLDRTGATSSKHRVVASLSGTGDLFEKEVHCQLLAPHLACQQTPWTPLSCPHFPQTPSVIRGSNQALQLLCWHIGAWWGGVRWWTLNFEPEHNRLSHMYHSHVTCNSVVSIFYW